MRVLVQRVSTAAVTIAGSETAHIGRGFVLFLGIEEGDDPADGDWLVGKVAKLRIFSDDVGAMNLSLGDIGGEVLVVSQFTLHASTRKGNRPSFIRAARPEKAIPLYEAFVAALSHEIARPVPTGEFGADMQVSLVNDGPVTIWMDSKTRE